MWFSCGAKRRSDASFSRHRPAGQRLLWHPSGGVGHRRETGQYVRFHGAAAAPPRNRTLFVYWLIHIIAGGNRGSERLIRGGMRSHPITVGSMFRTDRAPRLRIALRRRILETAYLLMARWTFVHIVHIRGIARLKSALTGQTGKRRQTVSILTPCQPQDYGPGLPLALPEGR
jgi:hypothetical protein